MPHRAHARSSQAKRSSAPNEADATESPAIGSGAASAPGVQPGARTEAPDVALSVQVRSYRACKPRKRSNSQRSQAERLRLFSQLSHFFPNGPSNGEVEGAREGAGRTSVERSSRGGSRAADQATRAHTFFQRPRRVRRRRSRPPPTCVRGTDDAPRSRLSHLALPHRAHARNSEAKRSSAPNEADATESSRNGSGAAPAPGVQPGARTEAPDVALSVQVRSHRAHKPRKRSDSPLSQVERWRRARCLDHFFPNRPSNG
jgi:hypothetical protein